VMFGFVLVASVAATLTKLNEPVVALAIDETLAEHVNSHATTWKASTRQGRFFEGMTLEQAKKLMGARKGVPAGGKPVAVKSDGWPANVAIPATFDSRVQWPKCPTIQRVRDQSACGSCWAFSAVEAMSDRYCVAGIATNLSISAQQMNSCCDSCGQGCDGGYPPQAWQYWVDTGVVSHTCEPYSLPSCDHHIPNSKNPCPMMEYPTPQCSFGTCSPNSTYPWNLHFGASAYTITSGVVSDIQKEILTNGPVQTAFSVYADFLLYKSGVYQHTTGGFLGGHAVKIIGWGTENGVDYWLVANSWNVHWGLQGFFKIIRGVDECGFEDEISAGLPSN